MFWERKDLRMGKTIDNMSIKMMSETNGTLDVSDEELIKQIKEFENINEVGRDGRTLLIHAAFYSRISVVEYLLINGADVLVRDKNGFTALHAAVNAQNYEIIEKLLLKGAPVNSKDNFGNIPLMRASQFRMDIIELLLNYGADCMMENNFGVAAYNAFQAYPDIIQLMNKYVKKGNIH